MSSTTPLLGGPTTSPAQSTRRSLLSTVLVPVLLIAGVIYISVRGDREPKDDLGKVKYWMKTSPVIDGHIDLPIFVREVYGNNITSFDLNSKLPGHMDIPRAREGRLGGFFWSMSFTECRPEEDGPDFLNPTVTVRDTLEQIDVSLNLMDQYPNDFAPARTADDVMTAVGQGKIASLMGVEGAHMLGNSLGVLRMYYDLGVRYMTLTHSCNNAFADSAGIFGQVEERWGGLSPLGKKLIWEMNRIGMIIDLSHVSDKTADQALSLTRAPVMWSHSCSRHFDDIQRNVPDYILDKVGKGKHKVDGVVMVNFYPAFALPESEAKLGNTSTIADHIDYIGSRIGRDHVGIGSDYDGIESTPHGLEDVSKYPNLFTELYRRGWSQHDLSGLAGANFLRVMRGVEAVSNKMRKDGKAPSMGKYDKRHDLDPHDPWMG